MCPSETLFPLSQGTASAFVGRVGPATCGGGGGGSPRGTGVVSAGGSLVQSPTPSYCNIASAPQPAAARREGAGGVMALLLGGGSGGGSSTSSSRIGWRGGTGRPLQQAVGRGTAAGPLWMARRETWTDIPMNDFYNALATYMCVGVLGSWFGVCTGPCVRAEQSRRHDAGGRSPFASLPCFFTHLPAHRIAFPLSRSEEYGSTEVPEDFVVPVGSASAGGKWPERMQGLKLGKYFKKLVTEAVRYAFIAP